LPSVSSMLVIYAVIVGMWAAVLVPRWHRARRERGARPGNNRSAIRVLARRRQRRAVPNPKAFARLADVGQVGAGADQRQVGAGADAQAPEGQVVAGRPAARRPKRPAVIVRRRRILLALVVLLGAVSSAAVAGLLHGAAVAGPGGLLLAYLLVPPLLWGRGRRPWARADRTGTDRHQSSGRTDSVSGVWAAPIAAPSAREPEPDHDEASASRRTDTAAAVLDTNTDPYGWEPVPVPLPTYVTAPVAPRPARRIDLAAPGAWTEGKLLLDERTPASAEDVPRTVDDEASAAG
jgi:hypothetical protein